jgi:ABC-type glycerol-3-phosphate transport system permease component
MQETLNSLQTSVTQDGLATRETFTLGVIMAGAAICVIPLLIMFFAIQNKFIESIDRTGLVE